MKPGNAVLGSYGTTVFEVMSALAAEVGAINLGQGFPDVDGPADIRALAARHAVEGPNQYPRMLGADALRQAIAEHNRRFYGLAVDWRTETTVTSGATEALAAALLSLLDPGDEVVLIEPLYDTYMPIVRLAGATARLVRMEPPHWRLPSEALAAAFGPRTKAIVLNSPHNPAGKVFGPDELAAVAELLARHDAYAVCDEVYEHLLFDGRKHIPLMTLPGMRERCIRIGSAGKTFSLTGWKVGFVTAPKALLAGVARAHQFLVFTTPPALQLAVAHGLAKPDAYFAGLAADLEAKRDRLGAGLQRVGFAVSPPEGTYFITADFRPLGFNGDDVAFARHITQEAKVAAVPVGAFYEPREGVDTPRHFVRFCFCKQDAVLDEAVRRLGGHFGRG